jgi:redox-sensitive bicupin YhaK (pirin superfamily)
LSKFVTQIANLRHTQEITGMNQPRKIKNIIEPRMVMEGAGVLLRRSIAPHATNRFDPFLLFDHFAFNDPLEGPMRGFPMHPHRGIETVTYMLEGSVNHRDSLGNSGLIGAGDVQWMTSGGGILHEEMPRRGPGGNIYGFQLWVNLPAALKMSAPRYQEVSAASIPSVEKDGAKVRVVAGEVFGARGPVTEIAANPIYIDVTLAPGAEFTQATPASHTVVAYVFEGSGTFCGETVSAVRMLQFADGDYVKVQASPEASVRFMLMAGAPFNEAIVPYGPFVMNTASEIQQALDDLRNGTFVK